MESNDLSDTEVAEATSISSSSEAFTIPCILWLELVPNNILPSGATKLTETVEKLRKGMFDVWKFAKNTARARSSMTIKR
jgi:hypothetical protein